MYAVTTKSGAVVREHTELLDAMDDLRTWGTGFQVRRSIDNAILAVRSGPLGGSRRKLIGSAELENGDDYGDRGPRK